VERIECGDDARVRRRKPQRVGGVREHRVILRWRPSSRPAFACSGKRCARGTQLGEIARANPKVATGSYPFFDPQHGANTNVVLRARDPQKLALAKHAVEDMLDHCGEHNQIALTPSHGENRGSSPLGSANGFNSLAASSLLVWAPSPTFLQWALPSEDRFEVTL
jgi:hypothetical protein